MGAIHLATALHTAIHTCFTASKVVITLLALELGASQFEIGLLIACYAIAPLTMGILVGRLADTIGMRAPMLAGALFVAAAMLTGYFWHTLAALVIITLLVGCGFVFFIVSVQNLVGALPGSRARNYSILTIGYSASNFAGPLIAGYSIDYAGHAAAFLVLVATALVPVATLACHGGFTRVAPAAPPPGPRSTADLLRNPPLRHVIVMSGLMMAAWELYVFYVPVYGHSIGLSASAIGLILAVFSVATFVIRFALPAITDRLRLSTVLAGAMLVACVVCALFPLLRDPLLLLAASFVVGLGLGCSQPLAMTLAYDRSPPGRSGEVTGLRTIATNLARLVVPVASGTLGAALGTASVFWMNAANLAVITWMARRAD
jgi:MFS family permease